MHASRLLILTLLTPAVSSLASRAGGQSPWAQPGERVRLLIRSCGSGPPAPGICGTRHQGTVVAVTRDSIQLLTGGRALFIGLRDIERLDQYTGRTSAFWRGARIGAAIGGVGGVAIGAAWSGCADASFGSLCPNNRSSAIAAATLGGVLAGGLLGGIAGAVIGKDCWEPVLPGAARLGIASMPRAGLRVVVSRFF